MAVLHHGVLHARRSRELADFPSQQWLLLLVAAAAGALICSAAMVAWSIF